MPAFPRKVSFKRIPDDGEIGAIALRIFVEFSDGHVYPIGTATVICGYLAITARHNLEDILERFGSGAAGADGLVIAEYAIRLYQITPGPNIVIFEIATAISSAISDISVLHLRLKSQSNPGRPIIWMSPRIRMIDVTIGTAIVGFGFHSSNASTSPAPNGRYHLVVNDSPASSSGTVDEVLLTGQPYGKFTFPCYRVQARFDGGMSGGPVFDESGTLCGIISGSYADSEDSPTSYVAMLWPLLELHIVGGRSVRHGPNEQYAFQELIDDRIVHVADLEAARAEIRRRREIPKSFKKKLL
jgi:hypothetical protein